MSWIRCDQNGNCIIEVHAQPQARKNEIVGLYNDRLKIKIKSPPVDGKANDTLIEFLANLLEINRSSVQLIKGDSARQKQIRILGLSIDEIEKRLGAPATV